MGLVGNLVRQTDNPILSPQPSYTKPFSVMPGDILRLEVYAKYLDPTPANWSTALHNAIAAIACTTSPAAFYVDGGAMGTIAGPFPYPDMLVRENDTGTGPKAYLNYLIFDRDMNPLDGGFRRLTTAARETGESADTINGIPHERLFFDDILIKQPGYVYIYLSNENETPVEVFFDDFRVEHVKSPVVQMDDYYPFGLTFNSYTREQSLHNKYLYNQGLGEKKFNTERIFDLGLNIDFTKYRAYDPAIGRWWQVDPKVDDFYSWTPYNYSFNNPSTFNDPYGDCPKCREIWGKFTEGSVETLKGLATFIPEKAKQLGNAYSELGKGNVQPALEMAFEGSAVGVVANQLKKTYNIEKNLATGNFGEAAKGYGAHLTEGGIAWAAAGAFKGKPATGRALSNAAEGASTEMTTVGRWMSKAEYNAIAETGQMVEGAGGQTFVTTGGSNSFKGAAKGSVYVEFQVPTNSLLQGGQANWLKVIGPNAGKAMQAAVQKQGGQLLPKVQDLSPILETK